MTEPVVLCDIDNRGIANVTLNRPEKNNAYNAEVVALLLETFDSLSSNDSLRIIVVRGNGRHFQAGADLTWLAEIGAMDPESNRQTSHRTASLVRGLNECPVPVISLVQGACIGGGTGIAAASDIVIASNDATFAVSEARWGAIASVIFPQLIASMGVRQVRRYALSCERFDAHEAARIGLVHQVCEPGELENAVAPVIEGILQAGPEAVRQSKRCILECAGAILKEELFQELVQIHSDKRQSAEATEGFTSFMEKRDAGWYSR